LADLVAKPGIGGFGRFGAKWGIDLFAGKSEITEGCSDLREIGDSSDLPGISDVRLSKRYGSDAAGAAELRNGVKRMPRCCELRWPRLMRPALRCCCAAQSWRRGKAGAAMPAEGRLLAGPSPVPGRLLEAAPWVLGID
jgi:hypothetical protein